MKDRIACFLFLICCFCPIFSDAKACVFCSPSVIEKQSVFETDHLIVLIDYEPRTKGHLLVIPKRHIGKAHELFEEEWKELSIVTSEIVRVFSEFLHTDQYIILEKNGLRAFQQIPHVHFHFFPVQSQSWPEIFDVVPRQLTGEEIEKEVSAFRTYFSESTER